MALDPAAVAELEARLGHEFRNPALLEQALTHRSLAHEQGRSDHYERLEFLGDAVLGLMTAEWLYEERPNATEGQMARTKSQLVSATMLARHAVALGLGKLLLMSAGEERSGGRAKSSLLADSLEAVLGAVYLDGGPEAARNTIRPLLQRGVAVRTRIGDQDAKTGLQEYLQAQGQGLPDYRVVGEAGPDHDKWFAVECWIGERRAGSGGGTSKKQAEQRAASEALSRLIEE